jgi:phosphohistidine phosphatase
MKTVLLVRHAKSDWGDPSLSDFDRPLNDRGKRDAPVMAHRLVDRGVKIDCFISSPAKRAHRTAREFAEAYKVDKKDVLHIDDLYGAGEEVFLRVIQEAKSKWDTIAIFSHNPGLTDFANTLTSNRIDNIPTSGVFAVKASCDDWKDFEKAEKELWFFDYPKNEGGD